MKKGFSFIEILVSITISALILTTVFSLAVQNIGSAELTRDRFVAANLAQEGIEIIANLRSNNWLAFPQSNAANVDPDGSLKYWRGTPDYLTCTEATPNCLKGGFDYVANYDSQQLYLADAANVNLVVNATGRYCQNGITGCTGSPTRFSRTIRIDNVAGAAATHEMKVISTVSWLYNNRTLAVSVEARLYNWR